MKKPINPLVAGIVLILFVAGIAVWVFNSPGHSNSEIGDTGLPPEVAKRLKEKGPQPMPPMPMPNGGSIPSAAGTKSGRPATK